MTVGKWSLTIQERNLPQNSSILYTDSATQQQNTVGDISNRKLPLGGGGRGAAGEKKAKKHKKKKEAKKKPKEEAQRKGWRGGGGGHGRGRD